MKAKFKITGLDCPNCAASLEAQIQKIEGIESATISFLSERLILEIDEARKDEIIKKVKKVAKKEEPDVTIKEV